MPDPFQKLLNKIEKVKNEDNPVQPQGPEGLVLKYYITAANNVYKSQKIFSKNNRETEMAAIGEILAKDTSPQEKIRAIQHFIHHPDKKYRRGSFGNSKFADCIYAAIFLYEMDLQKFQQQQSASRDNVIQAYHYLSSQGKETDADRNFYDNVIKNNVQQPFEIDNLEISDKFKENIKKAKSNPPSIASEARVESVLSLKDYYLFAIQRYCDKVREPSKERKADIENLRKIVRTPNLSDAELNKRIKEYFDTPAFKKTSRIGSKLKQCFKEARLDFEGSKLPKSADDNNATLTRTRMVRTWPALEKDGSPKAQVNQKEIQSEEPKGLGEEEKILSPGVDGPESDPQKQELPVAEPKSQVEPNGAPGRKVILAIHGLDDSVTTWESVAKQWAEDGYEVIAYDQASHGYDEFRSLKKGLNLRQMQYDLYDQIRKLQADPTIEEIHIVGHSLGGALIANCLNTIGSANFNEILDTKQQPENANFEKNNKIKSMTLISPAAMATAFLETIANAVTTLRDRTFDRSPGTDKIRRNKSGLSRIGGDNISSHVREFINFVGDAFTNLRLYAGQRFKPAVEIPMLVMHGTYDKLVSIENNNILRFWSTLAERSPVRVLPILNVGHNPHAQGAQTDKFLGGRALQHMKKAGEVKPQAQSVNDKQYSS